jgi:hypothetical protein
MFRRLGVDVLVYDPLGGPEFLLGSEAVGEPLGDLHRAYEVGQAQQVRDAPAAGAAE